MRLITIIVALILGFGSVLAQDTLSFDTLVVTDSRLRVTNLGSMTQTISKEDLEIEGLSTMDQWLSNNTGIYVRANGPSSSASLSCRGSTGSQFLVNWNGIPLQQFQLGVFDFSLLPVSLVDQASLVRGGGSSLWGSGAIGGVLELNNSPQSSMEQPIRIGLLSGSFGRRRLRAEFSAREGNWLFNGRWVDEAVENDFEYFNDRFEVSGVQDNARRKQSALLQSVYFRKGKHAFDFHAWLQNSNRQIPPNLAQNSSAAFQKDESARFLANYKRRSAFGQTEVKLAHFRESLDYFDKRILLNSLSTLNSYIAEVNVSSSTDITFPWVVGYAYRLHEVRSSILSADQTDDIHAVFGAIHKDLRRWHFQLSSRLERHRNNPIAPVFSLGGEFQWSKHWVTLFKVSRNYRLPTINDRYYFPGGNPDLLAEEGWSQEISWIHRSKVQVEMTVFNRNIKNGLIWARRENDSFFSSHNLSELWTRGVELSCSSRWELNQAILSFSHFSTYLKSTNQKTIENPNIKAGDQLIYTPEFRTVNHLGINWRSLFFAFNHRYTSKRRGMNDSLEPFNLFDFNYGYSNIPMLEARLDLSISVNNIFNEYYESIEYFPMPGRNYSLELKFKI